MPDYPRPARLLVRWLPSVFPEIFTSNRLPLFKDTETVARTWSQFLRAAGDEDIEIIAYCFMEDHVHLVVEGKAEDSDLKRFIARPKQSSGYAYARQHDGARLWQRYGHEHVLRDDEPTQKVVAYVLENPVRKGWLEHPQEYPFIGSSAYTLTESMEYAYGGRAG